MSAPSTGSAETVLPPQPPAVAEPTPLLARARPLTKPRMLYVDNLRIVLGGTTMMGLLKWLWVAPLALSFMEGGSPVRIRASVFAEKVVTRRLDTPF